jgi:hypothetical protein
MQRTGAAGTQGKRLQGSILLDLTDEDCVETFRTAEKDVQRRCE